MRGFAPISIGRQRWDPHTRILRHRHAHAYAALVLSGSYEECGSRGRFRVGAGDVLFHDPFDAHLDRFSSAGAQILNLPFETFSAGPRIGHVADADAVVRIAERDVADARAELRAQLRPTACVHDDWPDRLAEDLLGNPDCVLSRWARDNALATATISRGFGKVFGLTPAQFRLEARAHHALSMINDSEESLAIIAVAVGFADQAHMSRAIRALTGRPPGYWRRSNRFKTAQPSGGPNLPYDGYSCGPI
jgi:AraC-like DNA-binding protein